MKRWRDDLVELRSKGKDMGDRGKEERNRTWLLGVEGYIMQSIRKSECSYGTGQPIVQFVLYCRSSFYFIPSTMAEIHSILF